MMTTKEIFEQRLDDAISVMQRVIDQQLAFDMSDWYTGLFGDEQPQYGCVPVHVNECNTAACFAGHIAIAPEFQQNGWYADRFSIPRLTGETLVTNAVAKYFGWSFTFALHFCAASVDGGYQDLYDVESSREISPEMVLNLLFEIKAGTLDPTVTTL